MVSIDFGTLQTGSQGGSLVEDLDLEKVKRTMKKVKLLQELFKAMLKDGRDYGTMPNCGKPTLLKPGAEKILILLGLRPEFDVLDRYRELEHNLLQYQVKCRDYDRICAQVEAMANGEWDKLYEDEVRKLDGDMLRKLCSDGKSTNLI